jgi:P-type Mg2+ transporter
MSDSPAAFWSTSLENLTGGLKTTSAGLTSTEAQARLATFGPNTLGRKRSSGTAMLLLRQFKSPLTLLLIFAAILSFFLGDTVDAVIILVIVFVSGLLGFWQEGRATQAVESLLELVEVKTHVLRDGKVSDVPLDEVVPGDVLVLSAGDSVPGDSLILESKDLFVDEATLTGESYPVEKSPGALPAQTPLAERTNALFMGTHVISGTVTAVVARTGRSTELGLVSERLRLRPAETEFEHGVRRFGYLLMEATAFLVLGIFAVNVYLNRPVLDSLLFSLALAVGLTPQLLPAIISVNLARGAKRMAEHKVIVKRLVSIENFGSMNVLCSDKTGTLTEGVVRLSAALDVDGASLEKVLFYAYLNSFFETGLASPIDEAVRTYRSFDTAAYRKKDEIPYDFIRKRVSVVVSGDDKPLMVMKGALENVLAVCTTAERPTGEIVDLAQVSDSVHRQFEELSAKGFRTLGVAYRHLEEDRLVSKEDEQAMTFLGFLTFFDPPKPGIIETIGHLKALGVSLKVITGDNRLVAASLCDQIGLTGAKILTGSQIHLMSGAALLRQVNETDIFAEVEPNHKETILLALRKTGNVVGYLGDGINDAAALHNADVGISVNSAVDVAKEAADIVLLEKDLEVLEDGVREGRITFANTIKYVFMATSANFGNMFSMAGASLFLSFLPLLPGQILLTNLLTDFPEMTIATDRVDPQLVSRPRRWDIGFIRNFMLVFGPVSSVFDYLTFAVLMLVLNANTQQFRTGWFTESVVSAALIVLVIRTRRPFFRSRPSTQLMVATAAVVIGAVGLPYTPLAGLLGFTPLPLYFLPILAFIVVLYVGTAELAKAIFYRMIEPQPTSHPETLPATPVTRDS